VAEAPAGKVRWSLRTCLADALYGTGHPDHALLLYEQAAEEAEAAAHWSDVGTICHNWANALGDVGQLDRARETYLRSADAARRADHPRGLIVASELEALRIDVMQGSATEVLPDIEEKLADLRSWWAQRQRGEPVSEAPDNEQLVRTLLGGLDIACQANRALERWQPCLDIIEEIEQRKLALGMGEYEIALTRFNQYAPLSKLGRVDEARKLLEGCHDVYRRMENVPSEAKALSALADIWNELGDPHQALALARQALALRERLPDPEHRAISHSNLVVYLHTAGSPDEARSHQVAALAYLVVTGHDPRIDFDNLAGLIRQSAAQGTPFALPRLTALLGDPAFAPLRTFLQQRDADLPSLQARIDHLVEEARGKAP